MGRSGGKDTDHEASLLTPLIAQGLRGQPSCGEHMQAEVIGAGSAEMAELEVLTSSKDPWPHALSAEELIEEVFANLTADAEVEERRVVELRLCNPRTKRNRRSVYLDQEAQVDWQVQGDSCGAGQTL